MEMKFCEQNLDMIKMMLKINGARVSRGFSTQVIIRDKLQ